MLRSTLDAISVAYYGIPVVSLDNLAALWLAEHILSTDGIVVFATISEYRRENGKDTGFPSFNSPLFKAMA